MVKLHILLVLYKNIAFRSEEGTDVKVFRRILRSIGSKKQESAENRVMMYVINCNTSFCDKSFVAVNGLGLFWKQRDRQCTYDVTL